MARRIDRGRWRDSRGQPVTPQLFQVHAHNNAFTPPLRFSAAIGMPATASRDLPNRIYIIVSGAAEDQVSAALLKKMLLALVEAWQPAVGRVRPPGLTVDRSACVEAGWLTYLAPALARRIKPPPGAIVEPVPDGGLLLSASENRFDASNPRDLAAFDAIQESLAPLSEMPWPPDVGLDDVGLDRDSNETEAAR
ncbi:hypothetical protein GCM10011611_43680 [Aliidongia dinghuensis]|uniref:Immunity protein 52 domain-containing protein n=2 Tax=Aliidongia dinghuensis TaxID=1867774 RepID=A0A8J2YWZ6_9PROT|nr:hypothetical protein GCM10011611_43680 [Aliidongia dinghuensis]